MKKPDFIIAGEAHCGSTSLYETIITNPKVILPTPYQGGFRYDNSAIDLSQKELRFFDRYQSKGLDWYYSRFIDEPGKITGDGSATYFFCPGAMKSIKDNIPHCKIIILLRHPVDRLVSHFSHLSRINVDFHNEYPTIDIFAAKTILNNSSHHIIERGIYTNRLAESIELFGEQLLVVKSEDLFNDQAIMLSIWKFLGLDAVTDGVKHLRRSDTVELPNGLRNIFNDFYTEHNDELLTRFGIGW